MSYFEKMNFTVKADIVMETIWYMRAALPPSAPNRKLDHLKVARKSAIFAAKRAAEKKNTEGDFADVGDEGSVDTKGVSRNSWLKPNANPTWKAIKRAIEDDLPANHPVEKRIAEFAEGDMGGLFHAQLIKMDAEREDLLQKVKEANDRYDDLERRTLEKRYLEDYHIINAESSHKRLENLIKEKDKMDKLLVSLQGKLDELSSDNERLRKHAGATGVIENATYRLIEPRISALADVHDDEMLRKYQALVMDARTDLLSRFKKSPATKDVVLVFHSFNVDVPTFVRTSVPFRHADGNVVFACYDQNPERRRRLFEEVSDNMAPFKPRVIIIAGGTIRQSDVDKASKVIIFNQKPGDVDIAQRLWNAVGNRYRPEYDIIEEGYDEVKIVRVTNG